MSSKIHAVHFSKELFNKQTSLHWLFENGIIPMKNAHIEGNFIKYRIRSPNPHKPYFSKYVTDSILFILQ